MRIGDTVYFSPNTKAIDLDFTKKKEILISLQERMVSYYLQPAEFLDRQGCAFPAGVLMFTAIDAITYYSIRRGKRICAFFEQTDALREGTEPNARKLAGLIYANFRNGLVHEGRVKKCGQFSYGFKTLVHEVDDCIILNPTILLGEIQRHLDNYLDQLQRNNEVYSVFIQKLKRQYDSDIKKLKKL